MRKLYNKIQKSYIDHEVSYNLEKSFKLKIVCEDGEIFCDRLLFILWSKKWMELLDPFEETSVLILPDVKKRAMELLLGLLKKGEISGFENDFEDFMDLALDFLGDLPGGFSNFETGGKSFEVKAAAMKIRRNKFKTLKTATCEYCLSTFSSKQSKDRHIEIYHETKQSHTCSICNLTFKSKEGMLTHEKIKHYKLETEDHSCKYCDARFTNEANLKRHIKSKHDQHEFICLHCQEVFDRKSKLVQHQRDTKFKHTASRVRNLEKVEILNCPECDFKTSRKDSLARHKRLKHQMYKKEFKAIETFMKDNSNWTCSKCNQTFTSVDDVEDHVIHCKEIKCKLCDKNFTLESNLKRHLEKQHPNVCTNCNERFKYRKTLRKHMEKCLNEK